MTFLACVWVVMFLLKLKRKSMCFALYFVMFVSILALCLSMARLIRLPFGHRFLVHNLGILCSGFVLSVWIFAHAVNFVPIVLPRYRDGHLPLPIFIEIITVYILIGANTLIAFIRTVLSDPGRVIEVQSQNIDWTYWEKCAKCAKPRPPRSHHCQKCGHCVLKMDHHCYWTNNCVGAGNLWIFATLLFYAFLCSCINIWMYFSYVWEWVETCPSCNQVQFLDVTSSLTHCVAIFLSILALVGTGLLVLTTWINITQDRTLIETMAESDYYFSKKFDKNFSQSFTSVCGNRKFLWIFPCRMRPYPLDNNSGLNPDNQIIV